MIRDIRVRIEGDSEWMDAWSFSLAAWRLDVPVLVPELAPPIADAESGWMRL